MKMGCLFSGVFWGVLLILLGASILVKVLFNITIPILRIAFALLLVYLGIKILTGGPLFRKGKCSVWFGESKIEATSSSEKYDIVFGKGVIDLSKISLTGGSIKAEINTVFGAGIVKINPELPTQIIVNSAFSGAKMPDGNVISFGKYTYKSANFKPEENHLFIEANVVFGGLEVVTK